MLETTRPRTTVLATLLTLLLAFAAPAAAQTQLRWKLQPGQKLQHVISKEITIPANFGNDADNSRITQTIDVLWTVRAVDAEGTAEIDQQFQRVRFQLAAPGGLQFAFDSQDEGPPAGIAALFGPALQAIAKASFVMKMTSRGEIADLQVANDVLDAVKGVPVVGQLMSPDVLSGMLIDGLYELPEGPVEPGATWNDTAEANVPQIGTLTSMVKLTYAGSEEVDGRTLARIDVEASTTQAGEARPGDAPAQVKIKEQTSTGVVLFDDQAGLLVQSQVTQKLHLEIVAGGQQLQPTVTQEVNVKFSPVADQ